MKRERILQSGTSRKGGITGGLISLLLVAMGLFLLVGLIQSRFSPGASFALMDFGGLAGFFQGSFGWIPSFYFALLVLVWGGVSFVNGELSDPLKRILASICFLFFFSGLVASLGGRGGSIGGGASASMAALIGAIPGGFFFSILSLLGLFLATDWFFFKGFKRFLLPSEVELSVDSGLEKKEEALLLAGGLPTTSSIPSSLKVPSPRELSKEDSEAIELDHVLKQARVELEEGRREVFVFPEETSSEKVEEPSDLSSLEKAAHGPSVSRVEVDEWVGEDVWEGEEGSSPLEGEVVASAFDEESDDLKEGVLDDDFFETLENETLLEAAGRALDKILEEESDRLHQTTLEEMKDVVLEPQARAEPVKAETGNPDPSKKTVETRGLSDGSPEGILERSDRGLLAEPKIEIYKAPFPEVAHKGEKPEQALLFPETPPDPESIHRAALILLTSRRPLPSLLQRRMGLGLGEAREIFSCLKKLGALREPEGRGPWEPLMTLPEWEEVMRREFGESHRID